MAEEQRDAAPGLSRRKFLEITGGAGVGLVVTFLLPLASARRAEGAIAPEQAAELNVFVRVAPDGTVVFSFPKSEMGQGVLTSLAMLVAEELEVDLEQVRSEHALSDVARYGQWRTGGSSSVRANYDAYRQAGATARELLIAAAARRWNVAADSCRAERGEVVHAESGRRLAYGALAASAAAKSPAAAPAPKLKAKEHFKIIGRDVRRLDTPAKVDGSAIFGIDVRVPGMLFAQVERPPEIGGAVAAIDAKAALAVEGVRAVVEIPHGVAIVATSFWAAQSGRKQLAITWKPGPHGDLDNAAIRTRCLAAIDQGVAVTNEGDAQNAIASATRKIEAIYEFPYLAHATLEPMNCTASVSKETCEIWAPTQAPTSAADAAAKILAIPVEKIRVNTTLLGGGFGRRSDTDFVEDAVHLSRHMKAPVQVLYTREDDMRAALYRPVGANRMRGAVDAEGWPIAWEHRIASQSILREKGWPMKDGIDFTAVEGARNVAYAVPNLFVSWADVVLPVTTHFWRSVGSSQNGWVTECFFDELCTLGGKDPVEARMRLLAKHPRHQRVLALVAEKAGWGKPLAAGRAQGVAVHESFGSIVAQVAEVSIDAEGRPRVHRIVCAVDCGEVVHPIGVRHQIESAITMGLSAALWGEITIEKGRIVTTNYDRYPIARIDQMPRIETHIIAEGDPMGGIGEPGTPPTAPAICNALAKLTGKPIRRLPIGTLSGKA